KTDLLFCWTSTPLPPKSEISRGCRHFRLLPLSVFWPSLTLLGFSPTTNPSFEPPEPPYRISFGLGRVY
ncbi:hypothetical protein BpHYR1_035377, partial [Brachionus plicatilis]